METTVNDSTALNFVPPEIEDSTEKYCKKKNILLGLKLPLEDRNCSSNVVLFSSENSDTVQACEKLVNLQVLCLFAKTCHPTYPTFTEIKTIIKYRIVVPYYLSIYISRIYLYYFTNVSIHVNSINIDS